MNVLSLFDGMSCGQLALCRSGIKYNKYFSSEIDKYAIEITRKNYPDTVLLGDINDWKKWDLPKIDLILAGSPCQGFSTSGKQLNFSDERSKLYFVFEEILKELKPKYFLLENVKMKNAWKDVITSSLGVEPYEINSSLFSAQHRNRLYWTNIPFGNLPSLSVENLADVLENGYVDRDKSYCLDANYYKGGNIHQYFVKSRRQLVFSNSKYGNSREIDINQISDKTIGKRNYDFLSSFKYFRKLTPLECERLQTVPEGYTEGISNTQRYKMLGNGWTVDVISHILKGIK